MKRKEPDGVHPMAMTENDDNMLPKSAIEEIWIAFDAFDDDRLGRLSIPSATMVCLALNIRVTEEQLLREMKTIVAESVEKDGQRQLESAEDDTVLVTFDMICRFLQDKVISIHLLRI
jgi:Ca2+-binding EF-hand superfamily protein